MFWWQRYSESIIVTVVIQGDKAISQTESRVLHLSQALVSQAHKNPRVMETCTKVLESVWEQDTYGVPTGGPKRSLCEMVKVKFR